MRFVLLLFLLVLVAVDWRSVPPSPVASELERPGRLVMIDATPQQAQRLRHAVERFESVGLQLPDLVVVFSSTDRACHGHDGFFDPTDRPWRVSICSDLVYVYEHELAHAWERANLTDERRRAFLDQRGLEVWRGDGVPWNERGVEAAAFIIQQGLAEQPLPPALGPEAIRRLVAFELLTDRASPRLQEWLRTVEVPCAERPTPASRDLPDATGRRCPSLEGGGQVVAIQSSASRRLSK